MQRTHVHHRFNNKKTLPLVALGVLVIGVALVIPLTQQRQESRSKADTISVGWYNAAWTQRKKLTINHTKVVADQVNFSVLISFPTDPNLATQARKDGFDLVFTSADGTTKLSAEREKYVGTTGQLISWVNVPALSSTDDTVLYLYYGNGNTCDQSQASCDATQNDKKVWDSNYLGVWHMNNDPAGTPPQIKDSTSNAQNGTSQGKWTATQQVEGSVDGAVSYNGSDDFTNLGTNNILKTKLPVTISAWVQLTDTKRLNGIFTNDHTGYGVHTGIWLLGQPNGHFEVGYGDGNACTAAGRRGKTSNSALRDKEWYYLTATVSGPNEMKLFVNGVDDGGEYSGTGETVAYLTDPATIGKMGNCPVTAPVQDMFTNGILDEVRFSNISRSSSWVAAEYNNQSKPADFYDVGPAESATGSTNVTIGEPTAAASPTATTVLLNIVVPGVGVSENLNNNPLHPQRPVTVEILNNENQVIFKKAGSITFDASSGDFKGPIDIGMTVPTGSYKVRVMMEHFFRATLPGLQTITAGATNTLSPVTLVGGELTGDNRLTILDYNKFMECINNKSCDPVIQLKADINDDGKVDNLDYTAFLKALQTR